MRHAALLAFVALLAACGADPVRFAAPPAASGERVAIGFSSIEVREVSMPAYAQGEEIWRESPEGALVSDPAVLWADLPPRAVTLELARQLSALTGARIAAEPWPFRDYPGAVLEVRVDEFVPGADGRFRLSGQYYVAAEEGGRDRTGTFATAAPLSPEAGPREIAAARAVAVRDLARLIAENGL
ncbi:membrane integrity-associated transporter subunit PqiC [Tropicimonas sp. IMCC34011]|uniref:PqiC family protein n=1 Tax=Tropicimonas sp. IMCC34011 TaxID=2248759 RepID=UPI000E24E7A3|nr:ABC-type transport auxiliary lipoprotein family protein [Tropicimonas sp. IMCC34011]